MSIWICWIAFGRILAAPRPKGGALRTDGLREGLYGPPAECALRRRGLCRISRTGGHHYGLVPVLDAGLPYWAWRLSLSLLKSEKLVRQIQHNLGPKGIFLMVNHGSAEMDRAAKWCDAAGLRLAGRWSELGPLNGHRLSPPALSWWQRR